MKREDMKAILATVGRYVRRSFEPRIEAVEGRVAEVPALIERAVSALPAPRDGTSVTKADVEPMLREMVEAIPKPKDADPVDVGAVVAEVAKSLLGSDGLRAIVALEAAEAVAELPPAPKGEPGKSVTVEEVVAALVPHLKAHVDAEVAKAVLDVERRAQGVLERAIAAIPAPKDGKDGVDGLGFEDMTATYDGERSVTLKWVRGDKTKEFTLTLPVPLDRGYWREGVQAKAGDGWTHDGSWWIALNDTADKPGHDSKNWRMAARRGKDGAKGDPGTPPQPPGPVNLK